MSHCDDRVPPLGLRPLIRGGIDYALRMPLIEGAREHEENDHRPSLLQLLDHSIDSVNGRLAVSAKYDANVRRWRPRRCIGRRNGEIGPTALFRLAIFAKSFQHRRQERTSV